MSLRYMVGLPRQLPQAPQIASVIPHIEDFRPVGQGGVLSGRWCRVLGLAALSVLPLGATFQTRTQPLLKTCFLVFMEHP